MSTKICMIVHHFPPDAGPTAYRMNFRAEFLQTKDFAVDVFAPGTLNSIETLENGVVLHRVTAIRSKGTTDLDYTRHSKTKSKLPIRIFAPLSGFIRWVPPLIKQLRSYESQDVIIYTYNNPISLHLAALLVRKRFKSWVCEFRDPIVGYEYSQRGILGRIFDNWLQKQILKHADVVCMRAGIQATPKDYPSAKCEVIQLPDYGIVLDSFSKFSAKTEVGTPLIGVFAGTVFGDISFEALSSAIKLYDAKSGEVSIRTFGVEHVQHLMFKNLNYGGFVTFERLVSEYYDSDFTIVYDESHADKNIKAGFFPSKLAELIAICRPILFIGNTKSVSAKIIRDLGIGVCVKNEPEAICFAMESIANGVLENRFNLSMNENKLKLIDARISEESFAQLVLQASLKT